MSYAGKIEDLIAERDRLKRELLSAEGEWVGHKTLAALRKDAERYRWLRDVGSVTWIPFRSAWQMSASQCDDAIDREIERSK